MRSLQSSTRIYALLSFSLAFVQLLSAVIDSHPHATARATLQLLSSSALFPVSSLPSCETSSKRRWPILAGFLLAITLLIESVLRTLTALEILAYSLDRVVFQSHLTLVVIRFACALTAALFFQRYIPAAFPPFIDRNRKRTSQTAHIPSIAAMQLHASMTGLSHLCDGIGIYIHSSATSAALDIIASMWSVSRTVPLLTYAIDSLMHATPPRLVNTINARREQVLALEGVLSCRNVHVWQESAGILVGTLCVEIDGWVSKSWVVDKVIAVFEGVLDDLTVQVESWRGDSMDLDKDVI